MKARTYLTLWLVLRWIAIILVVIALIRSFTLRAETRDTSSRLAVLENRDDAIDKHLNNTDATETKLWTAIQEQNAALAAQKEMILSIQNDAAWERRIGWVVILVLLGSSSEPVRKRLKAALSEGT